VSCGERRKVGGDLGGTFKGSHVAALFDHMGNFGLQKSQHLVGATASTPYSEEALPCSSTTGGPVPQRL
jgi:hypothetical protein